MNILDVTERPFNDDSLEDYEYAEYLPIVGDVNDLNNRGGTIRINIELQDIFVVPSDSYLLIEGRLVKADGTAYTNDDVVTLTNNGLMYLFNDIRYELSGTEIERVNHPGWATTMLGLLKYSDDFSKSRGLNQLWYKDTPVNADLANNTGFKVRQELITRNPNPKGTFEFKVPLKHIFGFCEDYDKVVYGMKHTLYLTRAGDNDAIFKPAPVVGPPALNADGKVVLHRIAWFMPHAELADQYEMQLYKHIKNKETFPVNYRMIQCDNANVPQARSFDWRLAVKTAPEFPRYIIVGFQTNKRNNQEENPAIFNHVDVTDICITVNHNKTYPRKDYKLSFLKQQFSRAYGDVAAFRSKFFLMDYLASNPNFTPLEYKDLYPLFLFDISKQKERLKYSVSDIHVKAQFSNNVGANTYIYAVVISDRVLNFRSDGNKMSVVY